MLRNTLSKKHSTAAMHARSRSMRCFLLASLRTISSLRRCGRENSQLKRTVERSRRVWRTSIMSRIAAECRATHHLAGRVTIGNVVNQDLQIELPNLTADTIQAQCHTDDCGDETIRRKAGEEKYINHQALDDSAERAFEDRIEKSGLTPLPPPNSIKGELRFGNFGCNARENSVKCGRSFRQ